MAPTVVSSEKLSDLLVGSVDGPKVAVPVGTTTSSQLVAVLKSDVLGKAAQVAS